MGIHFVKCVRRVNGKIVLIKTETKTSLGGTATYYFPAKSVYAKQDKTEFEISGNNKIPKGLYQFVVQSSDGSRSVEIRAGNNGDEYFIEYPKFGDDDLLRALPECPGQYTITCIKREKPLIIGVGTVDNFTGLSGFFTTEQMYEMESMGSLFSILLSDGVTAVTVHAKKFENGTYYLNADTPKFGQVINELAECA